MKLTIDTSSLQRLATELGFSERRIRAAAAMALTRTGQAVKVAERAEMLDVFDRPIPYTLNSVYMVPATAENPQAVVGIRDIASEGRAPIKWLRWQISGGLRTLTGFEKALVRVGAMDGSDRAVPAKFAKLDAFGNLSRGQMAQIFSQLRVESIRAGSDRTLRRLSDKDTKWDREAKLKTFRSAQRKAGGQFLALPYGRGKLRPGIYLADRFNKRDIHPVLLFVSRAQYEAGRFDFRYVAHRTISRVLPVELSRAIGQHAAKLLFGGKWR